MTPSLFTTHTLYEGRLVPKVDLAEQFRRFAAMVKSKEPIGMGNEQSKLAEHGANILKQKENEY